MKSYQFIIMLVMMSLSFSVISAENNSENNTGEDVNLTKELEKLHEALLGKWGWQAARRLRKIGDNRSILPLFGAMGNNANGAMTEALESFGSIALTKAVELLEGKDEKLKIGAILFLRSVKNEILLESAQVLLQDKSAEVRRETVKTIDWFGAKEMNEHLLPLLGDPDSEVRHQVALTLFKFGDNRAVKTLGEESLVRLKSGCETLINNLYPKTYSKTRAKYILTCKEGAIKHLGETRTTAAIDELVQLLPATSDLMPKGRSPDDNNKRKTYLIVATALVKIGNARAVAPLIKILDGKNSDRNDEKIISALSLMESQAVDPALVLLKNEDPRIRQKALFFFRSLKNSSVLPEIEALLVDDNANVQLEAVKTVHELGAHSQKNNLLPLLSHENQLVRFHAAQTLYVFGDEKVKSTFIDEIIGIYKTNSYDKKSLIGWIVKLDGKKAIPLIVRDLTDWEMKNVTSNALSKLGWVPSNIEENIHWYIATKQKNKLLKQWQDTKNVLMSDILTDEKQLVRNAVYAFMSLGKEEIIADLIDVLDTQGSVSIAENYLNSGNKKLSQAAVQWAKRKGYHVTQGGGSRSARWGSF